MDNIAKPQLEEILMLATSGLGVLSVANCNVDKSGHQARVATVRS